MKKTFKKLSKEIFGKELTPIEVLEHYKRDIPRERVILNPFNPENLFSTYYSIRCFYDVNVLMPQSLPFLLLFHRTINFLKENSLIKIEFYSSLEVIRILKYHLQNTEGLKKDEAEIYARAIQQIIKVYNGEIKVRVKNDIFSGEDRKRIEEASSLKFPPHIFLTRDGYLLSLYKTKVSLGDIEWEMFFYHPYQFLLFLSQKYNFPLPFKLKMIEIDERERFLLKIRELKRMIKTNY